MLIRNWWTSLAIVAILSSTLLAQTAQAQGAQPSLTVTPDTAVAGVDTPLRFVGRGWTPNAALVVGLRARNSAHVGEVAADGTFDVTWSPGPLPAGAYHPFASAGGDAKQTVLHVR